MRRTSAALELLAVAALQTGPAYLLSAVVTRAETRETRELAGPRRPALLH